jgi:hypothetical protein
MPFRYDLTPLQTKEQLLNFLAVSDSDFEKVLAFDPSAFGFGEVSDDGVRWVEIPVFFQHKIPKKNPRRGHRVVWEPSFLMNNYKALARRLNSFFELKVVGYPHSRTFGYVGGRNIRENAQDHCGHRFLMSIDLEDFFPSIHIARINNFLSSIGLSTAVADSLSRFVTIGGVLPLGLPTSPTIANAICTGMDIELHQLALNYHATLSRYADDISLSSNAVLPSLEELEECIKRNGFIIAKAKTRKSTLGASALCYRSKRQ